MIVRDGWNDLFRAAVRGWKKIHEPRIVSFLYFIQYVVLFVGGLYAYHHPPISIQGEVGIPAAQAIAVILLSGGLVGACSTLQGAYWAERTAVLLVGWAAFLYLWVLLVLHFTTSGNRLLQAVFVFAVLVHQFVRISRIWERPNRPGVNSYASPTPRG